MNTNKNASKNEIIEGEIHEGKKILLTYTELNRSD